MGDSIPAVNLKTQHLVVWLYEESLYQEAEAKLGVRSISKFIVLFQEEIWKSYPNAFCEFRSSSIDTDFNPIVQSHELTVDDIREVRLGVSQARKSAYEAWVLWMQTCGPKSCKETVA